MSLESRKDTIIRKYQQVKEEKVKLEERMNMYMKTISDEFGVNSIEELDAKIREDDKRLEKLEARIEPLLTRVEGGLGIR